MTIQDSEIRQLFTRVCRDSGFTIDSTRAAVLAARVMNISPLYVWIAVGSLDAMDRIASGDAGRAALEASQ